ncbi:MAG: hypothetical protein JNM13_13850 [Hyphomicrobiaceae bacterium]|nr:hypothetical protein [Hyphomicrobiaceae bacterium]
MRDWLVGVCWLAFGGAAAAQGAAEPLLWTREPMRVDRSQQSLPRMPDKPDAAGDADQANRLVLRVSRLPRINDSTGFVVNGVEYRIAGVAEIARDRVCGWPDGRRWACGMRAAAAMGNLIRGRVLNCTPVDPAETVPRRVDCRIGEMPVALELARSGWALPFETAGPLAEAAEAAKVGGRGIHSPPPSPETE